MMKPGFFFVVVLGVLGVAGSAHGTTCDVGGAAPVLVLASPSAVVAVVASVGNGIHVVRGESAGPGWMWAGVLSGGFSIAAGAIAHERAAKDVVCGDLRQSVPFIRMYVGVGISSLALALVSQWLPEPATDKEPGLAVAITPWIVPMDKGNYAAGAKLMAVGF